MKDYYHILGVEVDASGDAVRKAYKKKALETHPDRNPRDPGAEDRFKEIAEAYGVLSDPLKRKQYDAARAYGDREEVHDRAFGYSQEEILRDLFRDPRFQSMFGALFREFQRQGLRMDRRFFDRVFFGGRGFVVGGIFFFGPFGQIRRGGGNPFLHGARRPEVSVRPSGILEAVKGLGKRLGRYLLGGTTGLLPADLEKGRDRDLFYSISLKEKDLLQGTTLTLSVDRDRGTETLRVHVPPGSRRGTRLRLKGKGRPQGESVGGDLYLLLD